MRKISVIGLGTATIASFGTENQQIDFYEINPLVIEACNKHFTYIKNSKSTINVIEGDAREKLAETTEKYDIIIMDGYYGDSINNKLLINFLSSIGKDLYNNEFLFLYSSIGLTYFTLKLYSIKFFLFIKILLPNMALLWSETRFARKRGAAGEGNLHVGRHVGVDTFERAHLTPSAQTPAELKYGQRDGAHGSERARKLFGVRDRVR